MAIQRRQIVWIDASGRTRVTVPTADPDSTTIMAKLQLHSEADVLNWFEGPAVALAPAPAGGTFADVASIARLIFQDGAGNSALLALPAPGAGIFLPDLITVDPAVIADVIAASVGTLITAAGTVVTTYVIGTRGQRAAGS